MVMKFKSPYIRVLKLRMSSFLVISVGLGYYYAQPSGLGFLHLLWTLLGSGLLAFSCFAINQVLEVEYDKQMPRTEQRPLPQGEISKKEVWWMGSLFFFLGTGLLYFKINMLAAFFGASIVLTYCFLYTPFKRISHLNTLIGTIPGALPPLIGWAAVRDSIGMGAIVMFVILLFWQLPHFLAIAWLYRKDYSQANFSMLSVVDPTGKSVFRQIVFQTVLLILSSFVPFLLGIAGKLYLVVALVSGLAFLGAGLVLKKTESNRAAWWVFILSLVYLILILLFLIVDNRVVY